MSQSEIDRCEFWVSANAIVRDSRLPNFKKARIQVNTDWNFEYIEQQLRKFQHPDTDFILDMFKFGWPLNAKDTEINDLPPDNQKGARLNPGEIDKYLKKELDRGSIIGPFLKNPFGKEARFSPLDTRPKKDSDDLRVILNLSHPVEAGSVNHSIDKSSFLGESIVLRYPTCEDLAKIIVKKGRGCLLFKRDLESAYCQMKMDAGDIHLLGFTFNDRFYFYVTLSMGSRSSCFCCQRTTDVITFIYKNMGYDDVNYLDDLGGAEVEQKATQAFVTLATVISSMGIKESEKKACPPSTSGSFLGVGFDTINMTMFITLERRLELHEILKKWSLKSEATLKELQQLLGKLNFVCNTVRAGRIFVSRIINLLKETPVTGSWPLTADLKADLRWWDIFMEDFDGITLFPDFNWKAPDIIFSSDACLTGGGGWCESLKEFWHAPFPEQIIKSEGVHINELEALALTISIKIWRKQIVNLNVLIFCDNQTTVDVVNTGHAKNLFAQKCLREICYITAKANAVVKVVHKPGVFNRLADFCSRICEDSSNKARFFKELGHNNATERYISPGFFKFTHPW